MTLSAIWSFAPQSKQDDVFTPRRKKQEIKHPNSLLKRFSVLYTFLSGYDPRKKPSADETPNSIKRECAELQECIQTSMILYWVRCSNVAWRVNVRRDGSRSLYFVFARVARSRSKYVEVAQALSTDAMA